MIIDCISDLHGFLPQLDGGDLLIVSGDLTARGSEEEHFEFNEWLENQNYKQICLVAGNHDSWIEKNGCAGFADYDGQKVQYLCDSGTEFEGLKIWGSPWTPTFCDWHFMKDRGKDIKEKWDLIPEDTDILITHGPPYGIFDKTSESIWGASENVGCVDLRNKVLSLPKLKLHVFGHIHKQGGKVFDSTVTKFVNASIMNEDYKPVNKPVRIIL